jgi:magnesium-transporting ATPase (P-type)
MGLPRNLFCLANIGQFLFVLYFRYELDLPGKQYESFGKQNPFASKYLPFLSYWNIFLQLSYFGICFGHEVLTSATWGENQTSPKSKVTAALHKTRDFIFSTLAFPLGLFTTISFWLIYSVNRNLICPVFLDQFYPSWVNHLVHTSCLISQIIEMLTVYHTYPPTKTGVRTTIIFFLCYVAWILFLAFCRGVWIYPVLQKLSPLGRAFFIAVFGILGGTLFVVGGITNEKIWKGTTLTNNASKMN